MHTDPVFAPPPPQDPKDVDPDDDQGKDSTPPKGRELKISMNDSLATIPKSPPEHAPSKKLRSLSKSFYPHFSHPQQDPKKKQRSGLSLGR